MFNFNLHTPTRILFGKDAIADLRAQIPDDARVLVTYGGGLSLIHISEPTRLSLVSRMPSSA